MGSRGSRHKKRTEEGECVQVEEREADPGEDTPGEKRYDPSEDTPGEKRYDPGDSTLTVVEGEDELDFELDDFQSPRALMSCGTAVTPTSLTKWCRRQLDEGARHFVCGVPDCDAEWPFEEVCRMGLLTPEEIKYFENKLFDNCRDCFDVKSCPGCQSTVLRSDLNSLCVECTVCSGDNSAVFLFCWQCLREWRGPAPRTDRCGNKGCVNKSLKTLKNCPDMTFFDVDGVTSCPSLRACPTCGFLLEHNRTGCKFLVCTRCSENFCFSCLKDKQECSKNSDVYEACSSGVAPRQTSIPQLTLDDWHI